MGANIPRTNQGVWIWRWHHFMCTAGCKGQVLLVGLPHMWLTNREKLPNEPFRARKTRQHLGIFWPPSGELTFCNGKSPFLMGKSTISMAIFNCYLDITRGYLSGFNHNNWTSMGPSLNMPWVEAVPWHMEAWGMDWGYGTWGGLVLLVPPTWEYFEDWNLKNLKTSGYTEKSLGLPSGKLT